MKMVNRIILIGILLMLVLLPASGKHTVSPKPRILISSDIGGTDPDDNQSMAHLLMFNERFDIEGLVSSPSFGEGSKASILAMIDVYAKDYPVLKRHISTLKSPESLRRLCKQGRHGSSPASGYQNATEGSDWIIQCARRQSDRPLWILVWGGLDDLAQALHDAPDIQSRIRVYWIGGPNKKWCVNSYAYIATHFPDLWIIENNASYRGFIANPKIDDEYNKGYYDQYIRGAGHLGSDFIQYYGGLPKMGDTPALLYMMHGNPDHPDEESWGGQFRKTSFSSRVIFSGCTTDRDTVPIYSVIEFHFRGPQTSIPADTVCFTMTIDKQKWNGYYLGNGEYIVRYVPKVSARHTYTVTSGISSLNGLSGSFYTGNQWPGKHGPTDFALGANWYTDIPDANQYENGWQGAKTVSKWRNTVLRDWAVRWGWLKDK